MRKNVKKTDFSIIIYFGGKSEFGLKSMSTVEIPATKDIKKMIKNKLEVNIAYITNRLINYGVEL